jgi:uncharacterized protein (DUF2336 family)
MAVTFIRLVFNLTIAVRYFARTGKSRRMSVAASLIPELENVLQHGSPARRAAMLSRITTLFLDRASEYSEKHVEIFDDVLGRLIFEIETKSRAELSRQLAPIDNAPPRVVRQLAYDDDISVAGPVLKRSTRLKDPDLVEVARTKGQAHLLAISGRPDIGEAVTDVLVRRGDRQVAHTVADNQRARISQASFGSLVKRAERDGVLAQKIGVRPDIPARMFRDLLLQATEVVRRRLLAHARPEAQAEIQRVLAKIAGEVGAETAPRDYTHALNTVLALDHAGQLDETCVAEFAGNGSYEETVAALSVLCAVPMDVVDRLMADERPDPVLILAKAIGFSWPSVRAIVTVRAAPHPISSEAIDEAFGNFQRLSPATAQRVVRFWQARQLDGMETV